MRQRRRQQLAEIALADEAATARLADDVATVLKPGDLVALSGELGAGKSAFARALIRSLAADPRLEVPSPTFALRLDYDLPRLRLVHADLYRIAAAGELDELGLEEALGEAAVVVEWPERAPDLPAAERLDIGLAFAAEGRRASLAATPDLAARLQRSRGIRRFLDAAGCEQARRTPLKGDASSRGYERVTRDGLSAVLMNAPARVEGPPVYGGRSYDAVARRALDVRPFLAVGAALRQAGLHAPQVLAQDIADGLLLLEDLGGEGVLDGAGRPILPRYEAAMDLLAVMHRRDWPRRLPLPDGGAYELPPYDRDALLVELSLFADWFVAHGPRPWSAEERHGFLAAWGAVLDRLPGDTTLVLRDFHSPNILWIETAAGLGRLGLIDFQDALLGHPAYDVASLAQDARAPLTEADEAALVGRYVAARRADAADFDADGFADAYAILAAQRASKVLGAFARLSRAEGKNGYARHGAHLRDLLRRSLGHPVLSGLRLWYDPQIGAE